MGCSGCLDSFDSFYIFQRGVCLDCFESFGCFKGLCFWCLDGFDSFQVGVLRVWTVLKVLRGVFILLTVLTILMGVLGVFEFFLTVLRVFRDCVLRVWIVLTVFTFLGWGVLDVWSLEVWTVLTVFKVLIWGVINVWTVLKFLRCSVLVVWTVLTVLKVVFRCLDSFYFFEMGYPVCLYSFDSFDSF